MSKPQTDAIRIRTTQTNEMEHSSPLYLTSSFCFDDAESMRAAFADETDDNIYSRFSNPNVQEFTDKICALEGAEAGYATASGMSAVFGSFMALLKKGDHLLSCNSIFGSTHTVIAKYLPNYGIDTSYVLATATEAEWEAAITPNTKVLYCETVSNPLLEVADIASLAKIAKKHNIKLVVDNTFSPLSVAPAKLGADIVIHSLTKYINGSSDTVGGVVCASQEFINSLKNVNDGASMLLGPTMDSLRSASVMKNLRTLHIRMKQHSHNAMHLANKFEADGIKTVYPGLSSHPSHEIYKTMINPEYGFGGMMTIDVGTLDKANALMELMQQKNLGYLAVSLGFYKTLFSAPGTSTSSEIPLEEQAEMGLTDGLIRFSIGLDNDIERTYQMMKQCMIELGVL